MTDSINHPAQPIAWLDMRNEPAADWTKRVVATNPDFVEKNGPHNFVPLYAEQGTLYHAQQKPDTPTQDATALADALEGHEHLSRPDRLKVAALLRAASQTPDAVREADDNEMEKISKLIVRLQSVLDTWGDTCVYIRRGGLSWGAVALNRQADDKKHGVFDLQAQHDRDMEERLGQVGRLKADRDHWRERALAAEALPTPSASAGPQAEAVAWLYEIQITGAEGGDYWSQRYSDTKPKEGRDRRNIRPLYVHHQPQARKQER